MYLKARSAKLRVIVVMGYCSNLLLTGSWFSLQSVVKNLFEGFNLFADKRLSSCKLRGFFDYCCPKMIFGWSLVNWFPMNLPTSVLVCHVRLQWSHQGRPLFLVLVTLFLACLEFRHCVANTNRIICMKLFPSWLFNDFLLALLQRISAGGLAPSNHQVPRQD